MIVVTPKAELHRQIKTPKANEWVTRGERVRLLIELKDVWQKKSYTYLANYSSAWVFTFQLFQDLSATWIQWKLAKDSLIHSIKGSCLYFGWQIKKNKSSFKVYKWIKSSTFWGRLFWFINYHRTVIFLKNVCFLNETNISKLCN